MKEKPKNGCNILIMTFTNLEKCVYFKKCLKQRRQPPPLPPTLLTTRKGCRFGPLSPRRSNPSPHAQQPIALSLPT